MQSEQPRDTRFGRFGPLAMLSAVFVFVFAATLMVPGQPAAAQPEIKWDLSCWGSSRAWTKSLEAWADAMEEQTDGAWVIEIHYGEALGPPKEQLDGLKYGLFDAACVSPFYTPGKVPLNQVMDLPFLPPKKNEDMVRFQMAAWEHPALLKELEQWNSVPLLPGIPPQYEWMGTQKIDEAEDFDGVRIAGMSADMGRVFEKFGAIPTPMPGVEVYNALDRGTIDGVIFPYTYGYGAYKIFEASSHVTLGLAAGSPSSFFLANKDSWDNLPQDFKRLHRKYYQKFHKVSARYYAQADQKWEPIFREHLEYTRFPSSERQKLVDQAESIWNDWVERWKSRGPTQEILDYMLEQKEQIVE